MSDHGKTNPPPGPDEIKKQVQDRIDREKKLSPAAGEPDELSHQFVMDCLDAEELGDGLLYAALHHEKFVFAKNFLQWFRWAGHSWRRDDLDHAVAAVETVALRYADSIAVLGQQLAEAMADGSDSGKSLQKTIRGRMDLVGKRVKRLRRDQGRQGCLKFAHTNMQRPLAVTGVEFDLNPWQLACPNGVINLRTGELEPGRPEDYVSKRTGVEYQGLSTDATPWTTALDEIYGGNQDLISYIQRMLGYGITGLNIEHIFPVMHGVGRNGKSIIIEALSYVLGDYAGPVPAEMLLDANRSVSAAAPTPEIMMLKGLRLAFASETDEGRRFSAAKVKWLTGGDQLTGRGLHDKHMTSFDPTHLLILLTNHKPNAPEGDFAFWERCFLIEHLIRFVNRRPDRDNERPADKMLPLKLRDCGSGILAWLVQGCLAWQKQGLDPPACIVDSTNDYKEDESPFTRFVEAACVEAAGRRISAADLYTAFSLWYRENINKNPRYCPSQKRFGSMIMGMERFARIKSSGYFHYLDLDLTDDYRYHVEKNTNQGDD